MCLLRTEIASFTRANAPASPRPHQTQKFEKQLLNMAREWMAMAMQEQKAPEPKSPSPRATVSHGGSAGVTPSPTVFPESPGGYVGRRLHAQWRRGRPFAWGVIIERVSAGTAARWQLRKPVGPPQMRDRRQS